MILDNDSIKIENQLLKTQITKLETNAFNRTQEVEVEEAIFNIDGESNGIYFEFRKPRRSVIAYKDKEGNWQPLERVTNINIEYDASDKLPKINITQVVL